MHMTHILKPCECHSCNDKFSSVRIVRALMFGLLLVCLTALGLCTIKSEYELQEIKAAQESGNEFEVRPTFDGLGDYDLEVYPKEKEKEKSNE